MALSADRILDMSKEGHTFELPAHDADTFYKGALCSYNGGRVDLQDGSAAGFFAGIVEQQVTTTAQGQIVRVRVPKLVVLPDSSAALTNRGQRCDSVTDDDTLAYANFGAAQPTGAPIGIVRDVNVGVSVTVEVGVGTSTS